MKEIRARRATAAVQSEALWGDALAALGYSFLFGAVIAAVLALHGLAAP
jgi:hypothetical protein